MHHLFYFLLCNLGDIINSWLVGKESTPPKQKPSDIEGPILRLQNCILRLEEILGVDLTHVNCQQIVFGDTKHILNCIQLVCITHKQKYTSYRDT